MFHCIWCQKEFPDTEKTRDHLIPKCRGGGNGTNLRDSCGPCNVDRGKLPDFYCSGKQIKRLIKNWCIRHPEETKLPPYMITTINRYNRRATKMKLLLLYWEQLEINRLGKSPSAKIPYLWEMLPEIIPFVPEPTKAGV